MPVLAVDIADRSRRVFGGIVCFGGRLCLEPRTALVGQGSDDMGVQKTRRFMLEWISFLCRLETISPKLANIAPTCPLPTYLGVKSDPCFGRLTGS